MTWRVVAFCANILLYLCSCRLYCFISVMPLAFRLRYVSPSSYFLTQSKIPRFYFFLCGINVFKCFRFYNVVTKAGYILHGCTSVKFYLNHDEIVLTPALKVS